MNKPSYTPGPLVVVGPYSNGATVSFDLRREGKEIGYVATISRVMPNDYRNDFAADKVAQEELEANVKVYAAAPEMAEALQGVVDWWHGVTYNGAEERAAMANKAKAALQKAGLL